MRECAAGQTLLFANCRTKTREKTMNIKNNYCEPFVAS